MVDLQATPGFLKLLAHDVRWQLVRSLGHSDHRVQELATLIGRPLNLVSYHLRLLRDGKLVRERRSNADARDIYYSLEFDHVTDLYRRIGYQLYPGMFTSAAASALPEAAQASEPTRVLFLCTHNSARSQMAEALLRHLDPARLVVESAGTEPSHIHPLAVRTMKEMGIDITGQRAKHLGEFRHHHFDHVITVCDKAREDCPVFPGDPDQIHWSIADPVAVAGDEESQLTAFRETAHHLSTRLAYFSLSAGRTLSQLHLEPNHP